MIKCVLSILILVMLVAPALAATNNESLLQPGIASNWFFSQPDFLKNLVYSLIGAVFAALFITYILSTGILGIFGIASTAHGNPEDRADVKKKLITMFLILIGVSFLLYLGLGFSPWW